VLRQANRKGHRHRDRGDFVLLLKKKPGPKAARFIISNREMGKENGDKILFSVLEYFNNQDLSRRQKLGRHVLRGGGGTSTEGPGKEMGN